MSQNPGVPGYKPPVSQRLKEVLRRAARRDRRFVPGSYARANKAGQIKAENIIWIFGSGRTGSTWLSSMMDEMADQTVWREPLVGAVFGNLYYRRAGHRIHKRGEYFILDSVYKDTWMGPMRDMVLGGAAARFPELKEGGYLVIKEPNGSIGASLLMEALPESRMILLVRDPRGGGASSMDARREGSWLHERRSKDGEKRGLRANKNPNVFVRRQATAYLEQIGKAKQAYDAHRGHKVLVRYEELRADALATMRRIYSALGIPVDERELIRAVERHSWENIPGEQKGKGKFYRKATPGGWQEDLTPEQIEIVEQVTGSFLEKFYPARRNM